MQALISVNNLTKTYAAGLEGLQRVILDIRGGESFDTTRGVATPRSVAVPSASATRLLAFFDISPSYKQVKHHLREASREHGVEYELLQALIATESGSIRRPSRPRARWA